MATRRLAVGAADKRCTRPGRHHGFPRRHREARMPGRNIAALLIALFLAPACKQTESVGGVSPTPNPPSPTMTLQVLVAELRSQAVTVEQVDRVPSASFPFFAVPAVALDVSGSRVFVFEYSSPEATMSDVTSVSPDGSSVGNSYVDWIDVTRFYKDGRVVVLYVGKDRRVIQALDNVLGKPFAGSGS